MMRTDIGLMNARKYLSVIYQWCDEARKWLADPNHFDTDTPMTTSDHPMNSRPEPAAKLLHGDWWEKQAQLEYILMLDEHTRLIGKINECSRPVNVMLQYQPTTLKSEWVTVELTPNQTSALLANVHTFSFEMNE
jgi:hypothetical protein